MKLAMQNRSLNQSQNLSQHPKNKSEARNPKFETNSNDWNSNDKNQSTAAVSNFEHYNFEFVSYFDIRISNLNHLIFDIYILN